jgi:predicted nucleic acid-binding protein
MQELLNIGIRRGNLAYAERGLETISSACGIVESVCSDDIVSAIRLASPGLESRDLVHLAVMQRIGCNQIVSTDRAFDTAPGIMRLDPLDFESWRDGFVDPVG